MRTLTFALVLTALAFTAGGVAVVGRADTKAAAGEASAGQSVAPTQSMAPDPLVSPVAKKLPGQCEPMKTTRQPKLYRSAKQAAFPKDAIPLNTRGYNYGAPEEMMPPPGTKPGSAAVPAAPARP